MSVARRLILICTILLCTVVASAQTYATEPRAHPVPIKLNGADWSGLRRTLSDTLDIPFTIVHIGDSHLQADRPTSYLRKMLQAQYGNAGRGLVTPFKMSGSYQPTDYEITSPGHWRGAKFLRYPWTPAMSFAGTALSTSDATASLTVSLKADGSDERTFNLVQMFHRGTMEIESVTDAEGNELEFSTEEEPDYWTYITLNEQVNEATITFSPADDYVFHAFSLTNDHPGLIYHTIGNGGADMRQYNLINGLGEGVSHLYPDLIILALGTNDSYNHFSPERFSTNLNRIVSDLQEYNPSVPILLVTPMEIKMTKTVKTRVKGKKGRRAKTKKVRTRYVVEGCATIHEMMHEFAADRGLAIYDWYEATGGAGASDVWVNSKLMSTDYVHLTSAGYKKHAEMLHKALIEVLNP